MSKDDGEASYGFAPHGRLGQQSAERVVRSQVKKQKTAADWRAGPSFPITANWTWLLIGLLLGAGGTMIGSQLWLEGSYVNPSVAMVSEPASANTGTAGSGQPETAATTAAAVRSLTDGDSKLSDRVTGIPAPTSASLVQVKGEATSAVDKGEALLVSNDRSDDAALLDPKPEPQKLTNRDKPGRTSEAIRESVDGVLARNAASAQAGQVRVPAKKQLPEPTELASVAKPAGNSGAAATAVSQKRSSKRVYRVQLAAVDDESAAQVYWLEAMTRLPTIFADTVPVFDRSKVNKRVFFRIWVGEFESGADAGNYCAKLKSNGQDCFVTRG